MKSWVKNFYRAFFGKYKLDQGKYTILRHYGGNASLLMRFKEENNKRKYYGNTNRDVYREEEVSLDGVIQHALSDKEDLY